MSEIIFQEAENFIEKAKKLGEKYLGRTATREEIQLLNDKFGDKIPSWYCKLISELPLIHMEIGWQAYEPEEDYDGIEYVEIYQPIHMIDNSFEAYQGIQILERGYVCIGGDPTGSGDPYFINFDSENPPVFQIYHDVGNNPDEILKHGKAKVADSFVEFFRNGIILEY
ncbi:SMI1/KNR4 family protein [Bacillus sp. E214]|uniref:SMI1/KNR4 family protein n=1 Tax=Bacillus sp. E214 TaxID=2587156 RepID=UPI0011DFFE48|nr:SMI1/KNR4 family protein [Bacillus sp. E214]